MATTVNSYPSDKVDGNPLSAAEVNTLGDGSELHHVNFAELFGPGVIGSADWNLGIVAGQIALTISAGQGIVGDAGERAVRATESQVTIDSDQGLAAGGPTTYYVFKRRDNTTAGDDTTGFVAQTSSTAPADCILIGTASMGASEAASVDNWPAERINLRNPIVLAGLAADRPTFGTVGRFWFSTDTSGGTLYYDTGSAWQQVAAGVTATHVLATTTAIGPLHSVSGLTAGMILTAISATDIAWQAVGTQVMQAGVIGSRPAASAVTAGVHYYATDDDGGTYYRSDGATWTQLARGVTEPLAFTATAQTGTSGTAADPGINVIGGTGGGHSGAGTAGAGGAILLTGGVGGVSVGAAGGPGGAITLRGGTGGTGVTPGNGGTASLIGGTAAAQAASAGGAANVTGAAGSSTGSGGNGGAITLTGGSAGGDESASRTGGTITLTAGTSKGNSNGGGLTFTGGTGGVGTAGSAGDGGVFTWTAGVGGAGSTANGTGGSITITGGTPGAGAGTAANGGAVILQGGPGAALAASAGGALTLRGGTGSSTGSGGNGGAVTITGRDAGGDNTSNRTGGNITLTAGTSKGASTGGNITATAGAGGVGTGATGGIGGAISYTAGAGGSNATTSGAGGDITFSAGLGGAAGTPGNGGEIVFRTAPDVTIATRLTIDRKGNIAPGTAALATSATDGFIYQQSCAGTPSGVPTTKTGRVAMIYDTSNNILYVYNGAWKASGTFT